LVQIQGIHTKLLLSMFSFLLLALVAYSGSFLQKGLAASDTHIVASGDWHCSSVSNAEKTVNNAKSMNPELILGLGDYSDDETGTCWVNLMKPVDSITKIAFGNHDVEHDGLVDSYLNHYGLSKQFYSFDIKNVHVLTMATEEKFEAGSEQYNFVVNDLRSSASNPDIQWIVVSVHSPFYSSPNACEDSDCAGIEGLRETYHPLFDKYEVDLVLQAHVRNYQRSFPLEFNQESPSKPIITSTNKGEYHNSNGIIFAIVGTGGGELKHDLKGSSPFIAYQQDSKFGMLDMHFSDNKIDARFVSNDGSTLDHFSIAKTVKKTVIERISDDTVTDTNVKEVSYKETTKAKPLAKQAQTDTVTDTNVNEVSYKETTKAKPLAKQAQTDTVTDTNVNEVSYKETTKAKPLAGQEVQEDKPSITFMSDEDAPTDTKAKPLAGQEVQEDKPSITFMSDEDAPTDTKAKPLAEQAQTEQDKPVMTTKLGDDPPKDDKPISPGEEKVDLSEKEKSTSFQSGDNADKSHAQNLLGSLDYNSPDDEVSNFEEEKTIDTNQRDPFATLN
jgi:hypothetical protein